MLCIQVGSDFSIIVLFRIFLKNFLKNLRVTVTIIIFVLVQESSVHYVYFYKNFLEYVDLFERFASDMVTRCLLQISKDYIGFLMPKFFRLCGIYAGRSTWDTFVCY